jgi:chromosome segregation ATPase
MNTSTNNASSSSLEEKIHAALATLRRDRDKEYRAMLEAQEREKHSHEELESLEAVIQDLKQQHERFVQDKAIILKEVGPLESHVHALAEQVRTTTFSSSLVAYRTPRRSRTVPTRCATYVGQLSTPRTFGGQSYDRTANQRHG